jgi:hypothetical protein
VRRLEIKHKVFVRNKQIDHLWELRLEGKIILKCIVGEITIFWYVTLCNLIDLYRNLGGTAYILFRNLKMEAARSSEASIKT